jgi:DNA-binding SARP family transcriptional activator
VATEFRVLGPVDAIVDGRSAHLAPQPRAVLAILLLQAGQVVPATRLIDALWSDDPPATAANLVQGYVSQLRKALGREAVETREPGYLIRVAPDALDLQRFERLATDGARALESGRAGVAAECLREALALWAGDALADVAEGDVLRPAAARLDELRLVALERRIEADVACGRAADLVSELEALTTEHPLRERLQALRMTTLYRCGRQADALEAYRATRARLVEELGLDPGPELQELEQAILRHDPALDPTPRAAPERRAASHTVLVAVLETDAMDALVALAEPLVRTDGRELVIASTVAEPTALRPATARLRAERERLVADDVAVRVAAFTSLTPGADLARLAREQDAELLLVDAPAGLLEDARLLALLEEAACDVAVCVDGASGPGPILVPFAGAVHDWAAVELGAWLARGRGTDLMLAGSAASTDGRDASRLLASASLAVQRVLGVHAEPLLVDPTPQALVDSGRQASLVVIGLTDRWRRDGVGQARTALAVSPDHPTLLVRRGLRPGGLAPDSAATRFTWTVVG